MLKRRIGTNPIKEKQDYSGDKKNISTPSDEYVEHEKQNLFPDSLFDIKINLYGNEHHIILKDIILLSEGINFEGKMLSNRSLEQMDITLERLASYRLTLLTAVEQLQEKIYEYSEIRDDLYAYLRNDAENGIIKIRIKDMEDGVRTRSSIAPTNADIDTYIRKNIHNETKTKHNECSKLINSLIAERTKLEKLDTILNSRSKELISILERRTYSKTA